MSTWRKEISWALEKRGETWADVVECTLTDAELDVEFDDDYGGVEGEPFTCWTRSAIYFPVQYDGLEWCGSVPRNPNGEKTAHIGA